MARRAIAATRFLVTGASAGIGRALARQLVQQGGLVIVAARRSDLLDSLCEELSGTPGEIHAVAGDVTLPEIRQKLLEAATSHYGGLDVLVNNAGRGAIGRFGEASDDRLEQVMRLNFFAPVELIRESLPLLRQGNRPMIVNMGSVLGHVAAPRKSEYCASKFALHGFSDSLRAELRPTGIDVLHVCPSTTQSDFFDVAIGERRRRLRLAIAPSAAWVARKTIAAIRQGRREIVLTLMGKAAVWCDRLAPGLTSYLISRFG